MKKLLLLVAFAVMICSAAFAGWDKTFALSDKVEHKKVNFYNRLGINISADVYMPKSRLENKKLPAIVVGAPWGAVKEQAAGLYAEKLAEQGFITLAFDPSYTGESGGTPRGVALPQVWVDDFSAALDYLNNQAEVDSSHVGVLGIGSGGSAAVGAAAVDPRFKAVALINLEDKGRIARLGYDDVYSPQDFQAHLEEIADQRLKEFNGADRKPVLAVPEEYSEDNSLMANELFSYYRTKRGYHPRFVNPLIADGASWVSFYPLSQFDMITPRPVFFIIGEKAYSRYFSEDAFVSAQDPKELKIIEGAGHTDLYDNEQYMPIENLKVFFSNTLKDDSWQQM